MGINIGRALAGVATGGLSEAGRAVLGNGGNVEMPKTDIMNPEARAVVDQYHADSGKSEGALVEDALTGTEESRGMLGNEDAAARGLATQSENDYTKALQRRAEKFYGRSANEARRQAVANAPQQRFQRTQDSQQIRVAEQKVAYQQYDVLYKAYLAKQAARAAVIKTILTGVGVVVGGAAGGAAGAGAGAQAGGAAGGIAAGGNSSQ